MPGLAPGFAIPPFKGGHTSILLLSFTLLVLLPDCNWGNARTAVECPHNCECIDTSVRCILRGLTTVPLDIPVDTDVLDLRFNNIRSLHQESFPLLPKLRILLLNKNNLARIGPGSFKKLPELAVLFVYKNRLKTIGPEAFSGLHKLEYLYMQHNELSSIDAGTLNPLRKLKRLHLHSNKLQTLPEGLFDKLESLEQLRIDNNPLVCDCYLRWLTEFLNQTNGQLEEQFASCAEPERLGNRTVDGLDAREMECSRPVITKSPHDAIMKPNEITRFECKAEGMPKPKIIWMHNSKKISMGSEDMELMQDGSLLLRRPSKKDMGPYECMAVNAFGATRSRRALLTDEHGKAAAVGKRRGSTRRNLLSRQLRQGHEIPSFVRIPADTEVNLGSQAELDCVVSGHPSPIVSWDFNGRNLEPSSNVVIQASGRLLIKRVSRESAGTYACRAFSRFGHITSPKVQLRVRYPPQFTIRPSDISIGEGSETTLHCEALAFPPAIISWSKNGRILSATRRRSFDSTRSRLIIYPVLREDAGRYTCHVSNPMGNIQATSQIILTSSIPPKITEAPTNQAVRQNEMASFRCSAQGKPRPSIHWLFNGSPVPTVRGHYEITSEGTLFVHRVTLQDAGHYSCQAVNDVGAQTVVATLKVEVSVSDNPVDSALIRSSVAQATSNVDRAINSTQEHLYSSGPKTPSELLAIFRFPGPQARELARVREIYDETLSIIQQHVQQGLRFNLTDFSYQNLLSESHLMLIAELSGCHIHRDSLPCTDICLHNKYRTYDGTCNNFQHPMWGASLTPFRRLLPPIYENGFNMPVGATSTKRYHGYPKPNARLVSVTVIDRDNGIVPQDEEFTHLLMQWGQFTDHDIDFGVAAPSTAVFQSGRDCSQSCNDPNRPPCFNIPLPEDDPRRENGHRCMEFERTGAVCGSGATSVLMNTVMPREQVNVITSFLDASNIYGSNEQDSLELRDLFSDHGLLKFDVVSHRRKPYLPFNRNTPIDCQRNVSQPQSVRCFLAGDYRANEQLGLLTMHTIWLREHNRVAGNLLLINPHWDGEKIYHETRKIVGAMVQHITYQHWLPNVLGPAGMARIGPYQRYQPDVNPSVSNVFATAAFRFGHSLINPMLFRLNASFQEVPEGHLPLHKAFFSPDKLLNEGGTDPLLRGLYATPAKRLTPNSMLNSELTERLFSAAHHVSLDLAALNIQRGRDHALPGYTAWRQYCNLSVPNSWLEMREDIPNTELLQKLQQVYGHPGNMDVWMGGLSEKLVPGSKVGPLFMCIIADQFKRIRDGDRFWYEKPGVFDTIRLAELRKTTLAKVICNNGDEIDRVPRDVFRFGDPSTFVGCSDIQDINFHLWQDCCSSDSCNQQYEYAVEAASQSLGANQRRRKRNILQVESCSNSRDESSTRKLLSDLERTFEERIEALEDLVLRISKDLNAEAAAKESTSSRSLVGDSGQMMLTNCTDTAGRVHPGATEWRAGAGCEVCTCVNGTVFCRVALDCT